MRPHGKARVDARAPRAHAICERCGFRYNHSDLSWDFQWIGPRLQNLRHLVCPTCLDKPQEGLRVFDFPPDPVPIMNARPEDFVAADNPISGIGFDPATMTSGVNTAGNGVLIGTLIQGGGLVAAFDSVTSKPSWRSARANPSVSGANNWIGCNWNADPAHVALPSQLTPVVQSYSITNVQVVAPTDQSFRANSSAIGVAFQGSNDGLLWFDLWIGATVGSAGETLTLSSSMLVQTNYAQHRFMLNGNGIDPIAVAQLTLTSGSVSFAQASGVET